MTSQAPYPADKDDGLPRPRRDIAGAVVLAAIALAVLDGAIVNVALPTIAARLAISAEASVWIVTGYQMALVAAVLPCASLGESLGYRRVFVGGVVVFTLASALCAVSANLPLLVAARIVQGLGAAAVLSVIAALLRHTYPHRMLGSAIGLNALIVALSSAAGPTLGATILSVASWPWMFAINLPIGIVVLCGASALPRSEPHRRRADLISIALNTGFFAPLVVGADVLTERPILAGALLVTAGLSLSALVRRDAQRPLPLIPLDLLRDAPFRISVIASVCIFAAQMLSLLALPFYLQQGRGYDAQTVGLYMTPWPLAVAIAAPLSGRLADRITTAILCAAGGACLAIGLVLAAIWPPDRSAAPLIGFTILSGLGFGFFQTPNNRNMLLSAPKARSGAAGGLQATARQLGQSAGAVLMTLLFSLTPDEAPRLALGISALLALAAALLSCIRIERAGSGQA